VSIMSIQEKEKPSLRRGGFTFKQFFVAHDRCAMKVGTDGVLLGAWAPVAGAQRILDIGTGSGLVALMLAQRASHDTQIAAVELEPQAAAQALENSQASPWASQIQVHAQDIHHFAIQHSGCFDLIVSNPPYFEPSVACRDEARDTARYTGSLTHEALLACAAAMLTETGRFCVVLPYEIGEQFEALAGAQGWGVAQRLAVRDRDDKPQHRLLLALARQPVITALQQLSLKQPDGRYTPGFCQLITDFYLNY